MTATRSRLRRGFTLLELSIAIMLGLATGAMVIAVFNQQLAFLQLYKSQNFLTDEAPVVSLYVSRLIGKADRFRLHDSVSDALSGANPRITDSPVVVLNFRQQDGTMRATLLSFENRGSGNALYYYVVPVNGVLGEPQWTVSKAPANVVFSMSEGVLRMTLTGPKQEQIIYSGSMQQ
ncbi:prepilin-type N-terminal cleavage/methylation domain-containing protein [bacterium]|nr:prepilin-type N-terminal cleavage/methylation domain-containing protein [bacterium]